MSNPQIENGFLKISNELYRAALRYQLKQHHKAVYEAILIKTYGFNKKEDDISLSQLELMTGILASNCSKACKQLVELNIIHKRKGVYGHVMGINKNYRTWHGWDIDWEWWSKDDIREEPQAKKQEHKEAPRALTEQEFRCWEWAKNEPFWQEKVQTEVFFLKHYQSQRKTLKTQYERFCSDLEKRNLGAKNERTTQQQHYFQQKYGINELLSGRPINASVNSNSTMSTGVSSADAGIIQGAEKQPIEQVEYSVLNG